ncbi:MAG: hypothetical protein K2W82_08715 [Candidatus Obscuribacterales bacterium]|nr:hypothetical protein [Candidatus Obscuribacterales bacterium]
MRVELLYTPGCSSYRKALNLLETVIAEERLPCPVELKEVEHETAPQITVDGESLNAKIPCIEELRSLLSKRWHMLTGMILQNA